MFQRTRPQIVPCVEINLDAPSVAAAPLPVAPPLEPSKAGQEAAPAAPPVPPAEEKVDPDKVIELSRKARDSDRRATEATAEVAALQAKVKAVEPVGQLLALAETDPLQFIVEIADVAGLSPERVLELIATKGAGGDAALSSDDRIALLERRLAERDKPKTEPAPEQGEKARQGFIDSLGATITASPEQYPLCADEASAPEAAFLVIVRDWEAHKNEPNYKPLAYDRALAAVEKSLRTETQRRAERIGLSTAGQPAPSRTAGGLSNSTMGAVVPVERNRVLTDAEIRVEMIRALGG